MLIRLAIVAWWFGAMVWLATALSYCYKEVNELNEEHRCDLILSEYVSWQQRYDDAARRYEAEHKITSPGLPLDELAVLLNSAPKRAGLDSDYSRCQVARDKTHWFALIGASVFCLIAFSFAFVFGGQFWLPPKRL